jgi:hypothetical protein
VTAGGARGVRFVGFRVADPDTFVATVRLYRDLLGLEMVQDRGAESVRFRLPDGAELHVYGPDDADHLDFGDRACVGLEVPDVDEVRRLLEAARVDVLDEETERDGALAWFHYRAPDGSVQEVIGPDRRRTHPRRQDTAGTSRQDPAGRSGPG